MEVWKYGRKCGSVEVWKYGGDFSGTSPIILIK